MRRSKLILTSLITALLAAPLTAGPVRSGFDATALPADDDASAGPVSIGFTAGFLGETFTELYVNDNGNITFDAALETFTPADLDDVDRAIIAPFFADVDTEGTGSITYGTGTVDGRDAFGVTWNAVGHFSGNTENLNSFQVVLIDREDIAVGDFDIEFNYNQIQWETGDLSGGIDGLGGSSARVGYAGGGGGPVTVFELFGSAVDGAFIDGGPAGTELISNSLNSDVEGRYRFFARGGEVLTEDPGDSPSDPTTPPSVPEPATLLLGVFGLAAAAGRRFTRR